MDQQQEADCSIAPKQIIHEFLNQTCDRGVVADCEHFQLLVHSSWQLNRQFLKFFALSLRGTIAALRVD